MIHLLADIVEDLRVDDNDCRQPFAAPARGCRRAVSENSNVIWKYLVKED
ncbi:hypothetical protein WKW80_16425 [Variovorax humicola]|uniref:Uncharacterized protein n=1 Tax=Variovorax humicola TaxID=1769758 RepID=A0ABU8W164_9BURK